MAKRRTRAKAQPKQPAARPEQGSWRDPASPRAGSVLTLAAAALTLAALLLVPLPMATRVTLALVAALEAGMAHKYTTEAPRRKDAPLRPWAVDAATGAVIGLALSAGVTVAAAVVLGGTNLVTDAVALVVGPGLSWWWLQMRKEARRNFERARR